MASSPSRIPGNGLNGAIIAVVVTMLTIVALLAVYAAADWQFVRGTLRALQVVGVGVFAALTLGLIGLLGVGLAGLWTRWASPRARESGTVVAVARARWPELPESARVSLTIGHGREPAPAGGSSPLTIDADPVLAPPPPALPAAMPAIGQVLRSLERQGHICRSGNSLMVGYDATGTPVYIELADAALIAIGGAPQQGKSSLAIFLIAQAAMMGWKLFICDPHGRHERGIIHRCAPLSGAFDRQDVAAHEIRAAVAAFVELGRSRINGDPDRTPAFLVIDEFPAQALSREFAATMEQLISIGSQFPKVGCFIIGVGYEWNSQLFLSHYAASLRRLSRHRAVAQCDAGSAKFLITEKLAGEAEQLAKGEIYYVGVGAWGRLRVPLLGHDDLEYAAKGTPPRPYTPTPKPEPEPAPQLDDQAPTVTVVSLADRIVDLLSQVDTSLTSKEIAGRLEADDRQVQTRLTELVEADRVRRTGSRGAYRYGPSLTLTGTYRGSVSGRFEGV